MGRGPKAGALQGCQPVAIDETPGRLTNRPCRYDPKRTEADPNPARKTRRGDPGGHSRRQYFRNPVKWTSSVKREARTLFRPSGGRSPSESGQLHDPGRGGLWRCEVRPVVRTRYPKVLGSGACERNPQPLAPSGRSRDYVNKHSSRKRRTFMLDTVSDTTSRHLSGAGWVHGTDPTGRRLYPERARFGSIHRDTATSELDLFGLPRRP
jgi:hypothetical protein